MFHQMAGLSHQYPFRTISFFIVRLLSHFCTGHSQLIGSPQPIVAKVGDDIILPCHLQPAVDVAAKTFEWTRPDLEPRFVYVWRAGQDVVNLKNPSYKGRTTLFTDELKHGNISLNLSKVKPSDEGRYKCYIPDLNTDSSVELVVEAVSSPVISLSGIDRDEGGVVLQCESAGWYPEPEVFWLDGEGNLLSAGPTETVRGPDDLYTVSSRVTVEKRHSNSLTCRVQQKDINQTRETHIQVPDDFFELQSSLSPIIIGLAVCLAACIVIILLLIFSVWKWRQNRIKIKRSHRDETDEGEQKVGFKSNKTEVQVDIKGEREQLTTDEMKDLKNRKGEKETTHLERSRVAPVQPSFPLFKWMIVSMQTFQDMQQRREEAENRVQTLEEELQTEIREVGSLTAEVQRFKEEKQKSENDKKQLQKELQTRKKEVESLTAEVEKLKEEKQKSEDDKKKLQQELDTRTKEPESHKLKVPDLPNSQKDSPIQGDTSSANQDSATGPVIVVEVDHCGKCVRLKNQSSEDKKLGGWEMHIRVNNRKPIMYTFISLATLKAGSTVTIWAPGGDVQHVTHTNLVWYDLKRWGTKDELQVDLFNDKGELEASKPEVLHNSPEESQGGTSQDSATGPVIVDEVDLGGRYVRLKNQSSEDKQLVGWELHVQVNKRKPITRRVNCYNLKAEYSFDVTWRQKSWSVRDKLLITLFSLEGEEITTWTSKMNS